VCTSDLGGPTNLHCALRIDATVSQRRNLESQDYPGSKPIGFERSPGEAMLRFVRLTLAGPPTFIVPFESTQPFRNAETSNPRTIPAVTSQWRIMEYH
jgi:hypothetical protein